ncbi:MAG: hypothetical protein JSV18_00220 [Candidatus Bathyarchaeota archaeon]|nr:MAG: hypothetical protein JSV18_00220 [Candidatus Bathyarchaeota archaeon]
MSDAPYDPKLITPSVYGDRRPVLGEVVALLHITFEERGLELIQARSRALREKEIHELMITDEEEAAPGGGADHVAAVAFFEVSKGGLIVVGDEVSVAGRAMGVVAGYDMTHMPNHMNVLVKTKSLDIKPIQVGDLIEFKMKK